MLKKIINIKTNHGLHMRVAAEIINISKNSGSKVSLNFENCKNKAADGSSLLEILLLEANFGKDIQITVDGKDELIVLKKIEDVFNAGSR